MEPTVQLYNEDGTAWDAFVAAHLHSTNYHQYVWRRVIEKSFGLKTYYLASRNNNNEICGVLPLAHLESRLFGSFLVSVPFFNYGGLLCNEAAATGALLDRARSLLGELSAGHSELRHLKAPVEGLFTKEHKVTMILDLEKDEEAQWTALDAKVRNQVRKAQKCGLTAVAGHLDLLNGFYEVFSRNMRDLGTPVYGKNFFRNILATFPDSTRIISVMLGEKTVASGLLTWFRDTLEVPWASSISDYREMCPNNLLYWEAIRFAIGHGSTIFDFGRSTPGEGTFRFKKQWGARPVQLYWQYLLGQGKDVPELNPRNPKYRLAVKVWQKLPLAVTNALGPLIVRNIP
ncbi:FemAB family XrtA/PEP-CTERM system-associated protein [Geobacter sp.]|uniref:FemAB family XrtA/PEP-CTERM system-associated protein n=1 Tax=Geobacter sp. TaxID=46610 RepID=UPI00261F0F7E|nr:FemAB family XrtA/PEP-CTERM system-associated protein [Geobacter sp.]